MTEKAKKNIKEDIIYKWVEGWHDKSLAKKLQDRIIKSYKLLEVCD
jgi:hypothetical protein